MKNIILFQKTSVFVSSVFVAISIVLMLSSTSFSHGGEDHAENTFTPLKTLQKATELLDRLIKNKKLGQGWENDLETVKINIRQNNNTKEYVISFFRTKGEQKAVYFFFTIDGKYTGSNFTGK